MVKVYANLIINGLKTIDDVPAKLRQQVYQYLVDNGYHFPESQGNNLWN